jgi:hypothetical protein
VFIDFLVERFRGMARELAVEFGEHKVMPLARRNSVPAEASAEFFAGVAPTELRLANGITLCSPNSTVLQKANVQANPAVVKSGRRVREPFLESARQENR